MTKKLEELFELPENNDRGITISLPETMEEITTDTAEALDKYKLFKEKFFEIFD